MEDIIRQHGLNQKIIKDAVDHVLGQKLKDYIKKEEENGNKVSRNSTTAKNMKTSYGRLALMCHVLKNLILSQKL